MDSLSINGCNHAFTFEICGKDCSLHIEGKKIVFQTAENIYLLMPRSSSSE